jgi:anaerobic magnesium-protoporphyrin IX monomethyl ester cyclase
VKFCLVQVPNSYRKSFILHETQSKHEGKLPPLSLLSVAAGVLKSGHEAKLIDCNIHGLSPEDVVREASAWGADALGFSLFSSNFYDHLSFIKHIKELSDIKVIAGGKHLTYYPEETLSHSEIDYGVAGEGDITIGELLDALEGKRPLESVDGIAYRKGNEILLAKPRALVHDLDTLLFPARHLLNKSDYYSIVSPLRNMTLAMVSRGCPYHCVFCDVGRTEFRHRSIPNVLEEMRVCKDEFSVKLIDYQDSTFNVNLDFTKELCTEIAKKDYGIKFMARVRASNVDAELARVMEEAGCFLALIGIESGDPQILKRIKKSISIDNVRQSISTFKKAGVGVMGYFVIGLPGDTLETVKNTISFSISSGLDYAQYTKLQPMPNSDIYVELMQRTGIDYWKEFTLNPTPDLIFPVLDTELSHGDMDRLLNIAFNRFYLRFSFIARKILALRNPAELLKYTKAAMTLISSIWKK